MRVGAKENSSKARIFLGVPNGSDTFVSRALDLPVNGGVTSPWLSPDGRTLYFSSDCPGGLGGFDLWQIRRVPKAKTVSPAPAVASATMDGPAVNTPGMKSIPAAASAPPVPKQWIDVTASTRATLRSDLTEDVPGGWRATDLISVIGLPPKTQARNAVLRIRFRGPFAMSLRVTDGKGMYVGQINGIGQASVKFSALTGDAPRQTDLAGHAPPAGFKRDETHEAVFAAQGDELSLWLDGQLVARANDSRLTAGRTRLRAEKGTIIEKIEYAELPDDAANAAGVTPATTTKDAPFANTLGMKFVPVPITGGPTGGQRVLFSVWDVRVQDYAAYAGAKKVDDSWTKQERDGVPVGRELNHPVVGVSWEDAQGFCQWLTEKEGAEGKLPKGWKYRLPSDEEWSWAVGLPPEVGGTPQEKNGKNSVDFPWGKDWPPTKKVGNYADETLHAKFPKLDTDKSKDQPWTKDYTDGYATTSPVGSFPANAYGLYDMGGNVWQWCEDWFDKDQKDRVIRGASWYIMTPALCCRRFAFTTHPDFATAATAFVVC